MALGYGRAVCALSRGSEGAAPRSVLLAEPSPGVALCLPGGAPSLSLTQSRVMRSVSYCPHFPDVTCLGSNPYKGGRQDANSPSGFFGGSPGAGTAPRASLLLGQEKQCSQEAGI